MKTFSKIFTLLIVYLIGQFCYDTIYLWTLKTISYLTKDSLHFFGKLWNFSGKPSFGLAILLLPILGYLTTINLQLNKTHTLFKFWMVNILLINSAYFVVCYVYGQYLLSQIRENKILVDNNHIHLNNVNLFVVAVLAIMTGTTLTFIFCKFRLAKNAR